MGRMSSSLQDVSSPDGARNVIMTTAELDDDDDAVRDDDDD